MAQLVRIKRVGLASLLIVPVMALTVPAQASAPRATVGSPSASAALPKVTITGKPAVYKPTTLTATPHWNGTATCVAKLESFTITNSTSSSQTVTDNGTVLGSIPSKGSAGICINTNQAGKTDTFGISSNTKAKLSVKVK
ncbi:MAG: hypothetical protein ACHQ4F_04690 [Candidatus Dormibacteria bacterium]